MLENELEKRKVAEHERRAVAAVAETRWSEPSERVLNIGADHSAGLGHERKGLTN